MILNNHLFVAENQIVKLFKILGWKEGVSMRLTNLIAGWSKFWNPNAWENLDLQEEEEGIPSNQVTRRIFRWKGGGSGGRLATWSLSSTDNKILSGNLLEWNKKRGFHWLSIVQKMKLDKIYCLRVFDLFCNVFLCSKERKNASLSLSLSFRILTAGQTDLPCLLSSCTEMIDRPGEQRNEKPQGAIHVKR